KRFTKNNLSSESEAGGFLLFPNTYKDIKQIDVKPYTVDAGQLKLIYSNVQNYFGVNEKILQNAAVGDEWSAFYEGQIEPFAIQFSETMTKAIFSERERAQGSGLIATANRLQYLSNRDKLDISVSMLDRAIMNRNEVREIWNLAPVEGGDKFIIRGEYYDASEKITEEEVNATEN
ncbi:MAG: phage portal protein, partial [Ruminococcus sp.]|nr:phage portal protein [Ruminococcus sp.]